MQQNLTEKATQIFSNAREDQFSEEFDELVNKGSQLLRHFGDNLFHSLTKVDRQKMILIAEKLGMGVRRHPLLIGATVLGLGFVTWHVIKNADRDLAV